MNHLATRRPRTGGNAQRGGRVRARVRAQVLAEETHCWLCLDPVDKTLPRHHPLSAEVDEIIPRAQGGSTIDRRNLRLAHRCCNATRQDRPAHTPDTWAKVHHLVTTRKARSVARWETRRTPTRPRRRW